MTFRHRYLSVAAALLVFGSICGLDVFGQALGRIEQTETNVRGYYHFAERGTATIKVFVVGAAASPGIYEVSDGTKLETLLILSEPLTNPSSESGIGRQKILVRLFRSDGAERELVYESELSEAIARRGDHPELREGDLLMFETKGSRVNWRDALRIVQTIAVLGLAIERIARRF